MTEPSVAIGAPSPSQRTVGASISKEILPMTVFTRPDCQFCIRAEQQLSKIMPILGKQLILAANTGVATTGISNLTANGLATNGEHNLTSANNLMKKKVSQVLAIVKIDVHETTRRVRDMESLSGRTTLPQIFFGPLYFGDAQKLNNFWKSYESLLEEISTTEVQPRLVQENSSKFDQNDEFLRVLDEFLRLCTLPKGVSVHVKDSPLSVALRTFATDTHPMIAKNLRNLFCSDALLLYDQIYTLHPHYDPESSGITQNQNQSQNKNVGASSSATSTVTTTVDSLLSDLERSSEQQYGQLSYVDLVLLLKEKLLPFKQGRQNRDDNEESDFGSRPPTITRKDRAFEANSLRENETRYATFNNTTSSVATAAMATGTVESIFDQHSDDEGCIETGRVTGVTIGGRNEWARKFTRGDLRSHLQNSSATAFTGNQLIELLLEEGIVKYKKDAQKLAWHLFVHDEMFFQVEESSIGETVAQTVAIQKKEMVPGSKASSSSAWKTAKFILQADMLNTPMEKPKSTYQNSNTFGDDPYQDDGDTVRINPANNNIVITKNFDNVPMNCWRRFPKRYIDAPTTGVNDQPRRDPFQILKQLTAKLNTMLDQHRITGLADSNEKAGSNGKVGAVDCIGKCDYIMASTDRRYFDFLNDVSELQVIDLEQMNPQQRKAFVLNLYNLMIKHAFIHLGVPQSDLTRVCFYNTCCYEVGGMTFTFNELENGILRNNRVAPYHLATPFWKNDPRKGLCIPVDFRIHFALNCGAASCPAIKWYSVDSLDEELDIAARGWCAENIKFPKGSGLDANGNANQNRNSKLSIGASFTDFIKFGLGQPKPEVTEVSLSLICNWYGIDFTVDQLPKRGSLPAARASSTGSNMPAVTIDTASLPVPTDTASLRVKIDNASSAYSQDKGSSQHAARDVAGRAARNRISSKELQSHMKNVALLAVLHEFLDGDQEEGRDLAAIIKSKKFKLTWSDYDWSTDALRSKVFSKWSLWSFWR